MFRNVISPMEFEFFLFLIYGYIYTYVKYPLCKENNQELIKGTIYLK